MTVVVTDSHYRMAVSLIRDLGEAGDNVVACDFDDIKPNAGFASKYVSRRAPLRRERYEEELFDLCAELCGRGERAVLLPVGARTLAMLSERAERFRAVCSFAVPSPESLRLYNDKSAVGRIAAELGIPTPKKYGCDTETTRFPAVVKPVCGEKFGLTASERYRIVRTAEELADACGHFRDITGGEPVIEEYLTGGGAGCSVLCGGGRVLASICHRRVREYPVSGGPSSCAEVTESPGLVRLVSKFVASTGFTGVAMFEFKAGDDGGYRLLEINPRVWGTYPLTRCSGSNFSVLWRSLAAGVSIPEYIPPSPVRMAYYPSDFAAVLGYLRRGEASEFFGGVRDFFSPSVKNGLYERGDPEPFFEYVKSLRRKRK